MKNGYFELHEGRKKTTGKWKINTNEGILLLTLKKREYIASYRFDYDYYARRRDPQAPNQYLIISMVWPGEKEVRSIAFAPVKL